MVRGEPGILAPGDEVGYLGGKRGRRDAARSIARENDILKGRLVRSIALNRGQGQRRCSPCGWQILVWELDRG